MSDSGRRKRSLPIRAILLLVFGMLIWPAFGSRGQQPAPPAKEEKISPPKIEEKKDDRPPLPVEPVLDGKSPAGPPRIQINIDPNTPLQKLLPVPPKVKTPTGPVLVEDLARVPEVEFQAPLSPETPSAEALNLIALQIAKINHLNGKKTDGFLEALRGERTDLQGLPFVLGDACRSKGERSKQFARAVATIRQALYPPQPVPKFTPPVAPAFPTRGSRDAPRKPSVSVARTEVFFETGDALFVSADLGSAGTFWEQYQTLCTQEDKLLSGIDRKQREQATLARIAALMQVLAPEPPSFRLGLSKYLSTVSHPEATRALARLVLFSAEEEVRQAAIDGLKVRRERDYTGILLEGLRYPWPAVTRRAADALVKLERTDLIPRLVDLLDEPDPRAPALKEVEQKKVTVVRELVRINTHKNCLLCHAPGNTGTVSPETITAPVPSPVDPLPPPNLGYGTPRSPDVLVRIDVTYLRPDFSVPQAVADAGPWPEVQRFDFLVRTRELTEEEARTYREKFSKDTPDRPSPYRRAIVSALRQLTDRDVGPTSEAWRKLLDLPARKQQPTANEPSGRE